MIRRLVFLAVFLVALLVWLIWYLPAQIMVAQLNQQLTANDIPVVLDQASGRLWNGHARWTWQSNSGDVDWQVAWRQWRPGVDVSLQGDDVDVTGWASGSRYRLVVDEARLQLPVSLLVAAQPEVSASGQLSGDIARLDFVDGHVRALAGKLHYSGGQGRWQNESATLPPMKARLFMEKTVARMEVTDENQRALAEVALTPDGVGTLQVLRAYADAVGMSQGQGAPTDVILKFEQPLWPAADH